MKKWSVGDRFKGSMDFVFTIKEIKSGVDPYIIEYVDGKGNISTDSFGPYLDGFKYLGNFNKSASFQSLYQKLQS